jgi:hypothetical protein
VPVELLVDAEPVVGEIHLLDLATDRWDSYIRGKKLAARAARRVVASQ